MSPVENSDSDKDFYKEFFAWQYPAKAEQSWDEGYVYDEQRYWGGFPDKLSLDPALKHLPEWAMGPFMKYPHNPVLAPGVDAWEQGRFGGGVHNGSITVKDGVFYYIYRGERAITPVNGIDYRCKIGLVTSQDGIHFERPMAVNPLFGADDHYSYEDVNLVELAGIYYLFCNRWDWEKTDDPSVCGVWLATSSDLMHWQEHGLVFPNADQIHRNGVVLQNPKNQAVRAGGHYVMYINNYIVAYSDDLLHWESKKVTTRWPGGEGCFALADYRDDDLDNLLLFTGGHHSGHFYAIGEVLFFRSDPETPMDWLPRPVLTAEAAYPFESGYSATEPGKRISNYRDCIFFNGLTRIGKQWMMYYGGSEYYTCLAMKTEG